MVAGIIADELALDLYQIDLSRIVSKYVGETEKNLAKVFNRAQHKGWILFFDEADALFGRRGETKDAAGNGRRPVIAQRLEAAFLGDTRFHHDRSRRTVG